MNPKNKELTSTTDIAKNNVLALLEELQLKLIAMSCYAQENLNEKGFAVTKMNIDEIKLWIKQKRSQHCG
jgi:hypothetical protein